MTDWIAAERDLAALPRRAVAAFAARAGRRVAPLVGRAADVYGPEAWEWLNAVAATIRAVESLARGEPVSRFTLDVAAELARTAATATAAAARQHGPSAVIEPAELAYAAAAFAADAARSPSPSRAAAMATRSARNADATGLPVGRLQLLDLRTLAGMALGTDDGLGTTVDPSDAGPLGELWPASEPDGWNEIWETYQSLALPRLIVTG